MSKEIKNLISGVNTLIDYIEDNPYITDQIPKETIGHWVPEIRRRINRVEQLKPKQK